MKLIKVYQTNMNKKKLKKYKWNFKNKIYLNKKK